MSSLDGPGARLEEERKVVSVLFADLVGFTARSEASDPEDVRAILRRYHRHLKQEIERFGGKVEKFVGDAVMAVFGAPAAHEDDAERAVRAALRIVETVDELNHEQPDLDLAVRVAVNTGEAVVALAARPEEGEGMVAGDVVNTAARLQQAAPVGGVVVGEATWRSTRYVAEYKELEPVDLKGKAAPVRLWQAKEARSRVKAERPRATPFVGRKGELAALQEVFTRGIEARSVDLVTIIGEPGAGKSRLVAELRAFVDERAELVSWRQGQCLPYGEGITFWALGEIVKAEAGILESDGPDQAAAKLATALAATFEDAAEREWLQSGLAPLVGASTAAMDAAGERGASFTAWRRFFEAVGARRPLVLVFEDLHWGDTALVEFVEHLVEWASDVALLVVCTARPELYDRHPAWGAGKRASTTVALQPLSDDETMSLIAALTERALPPDTQAALLGRAGGNPLFAEEFVRMLRDRGNGAAGDVLVPETVQALIAARLDALSPAQKSLAHDASVVGEIFWAGALASMGGLDELAVERGLHELARKELVRPVRTSSVQGQAEFSFWHILVRDVAYGQIPRLARIEKHRAAAAWIERIAGERVTDHAELLAHHYEQALELAQAAGSQVSGELRPPAARFLLLAGDRAVRLDVARAESFYRRALALLPDEDPERAIALTKIADAAQEAGRLHEAAQQYEEAISAFRSREERVGAGVATTRLAHALWRLGETARSRALLDEAIPELETVAARADLARAYGQKAIVHMVSEEAEDCLAWSQRTLEMAEELGLDDLRVRIRQARGLARRMLGDLGGVDDLREALRLGHELALGIETGTSYANLADALRFIEGPLASLEVTKAGIEFSSRRGLMHNVTWLKTEGLRALFDLGRWDELLRVADEVIAWDEAYGGSQIEVIAHEARAAVFLCRGELTAAAGLEEVFLPRARSIRDAQVLAPALALGAAIEQAQGDHPTGVRLIEELAVLTADKPVSRSGELLTAVRVCTAGGALDLAERFLAEAAEVEARDRYSVLTGRAVLAEARGELELAAGLYAEAAVRWAEHGHVLEQGLALLGAGRSLRALGRRDEATSHLTDARAIFVRLGARPFVAEADAALKGSE
jgi:class 3 adenylate cyclase/tetratricopeptide (TPR) repeat protein